MEVWKNEQAVTLLKLVKSHPETLTTRTLYRTLNAEVNYDYFKCY